MVRKEDLESIQDMKENTCRGCNNLSEKIHYEFYDDAGTTLRDTPEKTIQPYCTEHGLHLHFVRSFLANSVWSYDRCKYPNCPRFWNG